jgi:hypothetical protein
MKLANLTDGLLKLAGPKSLIIQKNSPEILLTVGIVGVVASAVLACRATLKADTVIKEHQHKKDKINFTWDRVKNGEIPLDDYSERDHQKDLAVTYFQTATKFLILYGPAITLGAASIACIITGHGIMKSRNLAIMAAYKAVEEGFSAYRRRVVEEHGEDVDYMYRHGLKAEDVTEIEIREDGKIRKVKKTKLVADPNSLSMYSKFFDESCSQWTKTPEYNFMFLKSQQNYFNDMLRARGHVFLNEVYDALGIQRTKAGAVVGWVLGDGDGFIDFGLFDGERQRVRDFVNGYERSILLDFNVDGMIYDKL